MDPFDSSREAKKKKNVENKFILKVKSNFEHFQWNQRITSKIRNSDLRKNKVDR